MKIIDDSTTTQVKQVFAFPAVTCSIALPVADLRQIVLHPDTLAQGGASFTGPLSHAQFLKKLLLRVEIDAPPALTPCAARPLRAGGASLGGDVQLRQQAPGLYV
jgi:hypothetical protein